MLVPFAGLAAGGLHAVTGPDHIAALAPLAIQDSRRAAWMGVVWGLGHGLGVGLIGLFAVALRGIVSLDALSGWSELAVGGLLVAVGLWSIRRAWRLTIHIHPHDHAGEGHAHVHVHRALDEAAHAGPEAHRVHTHAAFAVGTLHGAAGTGHLFGALPALALPPGEAALYLACYLLGATGAMAGCGVLLGHVARAGGPRLLRGLMASTGVLAVVVGVFWIAGT